MEAESGGRAQGRERSRGSRRPLVAIGIVGLVLIAAVGSYTLWSRQDEYVRRPVAWNAVTVSEDGRTLSFHPYGLGACDEQDGVEFVGDPLVDGRVVATTYYRQLVRRGGEPIFCNASLSIGGPPFSVTLDQPVDPDLVLTDGAPPDVFFCSRSRTQRVGDVVPIQHDDVGQCP